MSAHPLNNFVQVFRVGSLPRSFLPGSMKTLPGLFLMQTRSAAVTDGRFLRPTSRPDRPSRCCIISLCWNGPVLNIVPCLQREPCSASSKNSHNNHFFTQISYETTSTLASGCSPHCHWLVKKMLSTISYHMYAWKVFVVKHCQRHNGPEG